MGDFPASGPHLTLSGRSGRYVGGQAEPLPTQERGQSHQQPVGVLSVGSASTRAQTQGHTHTRSAGVTIPLHAPYFLISAPSSRLPCLQVPPGRLHRACDAARCPTHPDGPPFSGFVLESLLSGPSTERRVPGQSPAASPGPAWAAAESADGLLGRRGGGTGRWVPRGHGKGPMLRGAGEGWPLQAPGQS